MTHHKPLIDLDMPKRCKIARQAPYFIHRYLLKNMNSTIHLPFVSLGYSKLNSVMRPI